MKCKHSASGSFELAMSLPEALVFSGRLAAHAANAGETNPIKIGMSFHHRWGIPIFYVASEYTTCPMMNDGECTLGEFAPVSCQMFPAVRYLPADALPATVEERRALMQYTWARLPESGAECAPADMEDQVSPWMLDVVDQYWAIAALMVKERLSVPTPAHPFNSGKKEIITGLFGYREMIEMMQLIASLTPMEWQYKVMDLLADIRRKVGEISAEIHECGLPHGSYILDNENGGTYNRSEIRMMGGGGHGA